MSSKHIIIVLVVALAAKLTYFIFAGFLRYDIEASLLKRNDSYWYETVAVNGHEQITPDQLGSCEDDHIEQSYYAFFPLYPFLIRATILLAGLSFDTSALIWSLIISLSLFAAFYKYARGELDSKREALISSLILVVFPFPYYFSVFSTEGLFLLLLILAFYALRNRNSVLFIVATSLLVLVRPNGLFMLLPLGLFFLEERGFALKNWNTLKEMSTWKRGVMQFAPAVVLFILYCVYLYVMTGDFFAYKTAQAGWCRETVMPWVPLLRFEEEYHLFKVMYLVLFSAVALYLLPRIRLSYSAMIWMGLLVPLIANSVTLPRFISVIFVFSLFFGQALAKTPRPVQTIVLIGLFLLQLWTFTYWLESSTFSF